MPIAAAERLLSGSLEYSASVFASAGVHSRTLQLMPPLQHNVG
jgi:hypothetical protein